ncbi:ATP-binding protein [Chamaesiphon sp.]|uniref:ATP-binding protein n=1 Tax=Chamaesiphon sp. TaxID=2814140 RepID=UPI003593BC5D
MHPNSGNTCDKSRTILIVEDSPIYRELLQNYLYQDDRYNYTILETETGAQGLQQYQIAQPDAILLDYLLPDMNGLEFLQALQQQIDKPDLPVVLLTGYEGEQLATRAIEFGAQQYLNKSQLTTENLRLSLHHAIKQGDLLRQVAALQAQNDRHLAVLARQEEQLRLALASARMGMWDWNLRSGEIEWNQEQEQLFGLLPGSFDGTAGTFTGYIHPDDRPLVLRFVENTIAEGAILCHQFRIVWADGCIHWIETRGEVHFDEAGEPMRMIGTAINIDDRHQAQQLLQNQLEQQRLVMDMTIRIRRSLDLSEILQTTVDEVRQFLQTDRVIVYEFAPDWSGTAIVESVGADWKAILNTTIYVTCIELYLEDFQRGVGTANADIYNAGIDEWYIQLLESLQIRANLLVPIFKGDTLWGLLTAHHCSAPRPWQTAEIELLEQIASQVSIAIHQADLLTQAQSELTHRNHAEMTLQLLNAELAQRQAVEQLKDEFIGIVSHELRTPLTSMQGALGLVAMGVMDDDPAQMKQMIEIAAIETERLVRMVNDILDLEKLASNSHVLAPEWCDANTIIQQAIASTIGSADAAHVQLELDCPPLQIWVAPDRIVQIFTNLLSNAIKFSHPGGVVSIAVSTATASPEPISSGLTRSDLARSPVTMRGQQIHFTVQDRGRGIPPAKLETIFDRFQQVDSSDARDKGGTGLGLAICKSIVLQYQGQIWVESVWGHGSTFFVILPQPMNEN